jgi:hypothetical protein
VNQIEYVRTRRHKDFTAGDGHMRGDFENAVLGMACAPQRMRAYRMPSKNLL